MIRDLQDAKLGDPKRLAYIIKRIENGRSIYNSDEDYVREKFRQLREELECGSDSNPEQTPIPDNKDLPPQKSKNSGAIKVALVTSLLFLIPISIIGIMHDLSPGRYMSQSSLIGITIWIVFWLGMTVVLIGCLRPRWMNKLLIFEGVVALLAGVSVTSGTTPLQAQLLLVGIGIVSIAIAIIRKRRKSWHVTAHFPPLRWLRMINSPKRAILVILVAIIMWIGLGSVALDMQPVPDSNTEMELIEQRGEAGVVNMSSYFTEIERLEADGCVLMEELNVLSIELDRIYGIELDRLHYNTNDGNTEELDRNIAETNRVVAELEGVIAVSEKFEAKNLEMMRLMAEGQIMLAELDRSDVEVRKFILKEDINSEREGSNNPELMRLVAEEDRALAELNRMIAEIDRIGAINPTLNPLC